jgi:hypothetical protein
MAEGVENETNNITDLERRVDCHVGNACWMETQGLETVVIVCARDMCLPPHDAANAETEMLPMYLEEEPRMKEIRRENHTLDREGTAGRSVRVIPCR